MLMKKLFVVSVLAMTLFSGCSGKKDEVKEIVLKWPSFWVGKDTKAPTVGALVEEFNTANAGKIRVDVEANPDVDGFRDKLNTQISSGLVPDLFVLNPDPTSYSFYDGDLLMDFTDELKKPEWDVFTGGSVEAVTINGRTKSLPYELALTPIWYNADLLEQAGYSSFPENYEEFRDMLEALKANGTTPTSQMTGGTNAWTSMLWFSHLAVMIGGPGVWDKPFTDPDFVQAAQLLLELYSDGNTTKDAVGGGPAESGAHYLSANTAMFINGPWYIARLKDEAPAVHESTRLASVPVLPGGTPNLQIGFELSNLAAANTDDEAKRDAVLSFLNWMTRPENVKKISLSAGSMFAIKYELTDADDLDPLMRRYINVSSGAAAIVNPISMKVPTDVMAEFGQQLGSMALGRITPEEMMARLQQMMEQ